MQNLQQKTKIFLILGLIALIAEALVLANLYQLGDETQAVFNAAEASLTVLVLTLIPAGLLLISFSYRLNKAWMRALGFALVLLELCAIIFLS